MQVAYLLFEYSKQSERCNLLNLRGPTAGVGRVKVEAQAVGDQHRITLLQSRVLLQLQLTKLATPTSF